MTRQYESNVLASVHETALGMSEAGAISKQKMRNFDEMCLTPVKPAAPEETRTRRVREKASQAVSDRSLR